ncbi:hypothetical protein [Spiroplasma poulsonii]|uniref:hypothetical protein n=1 Tax=Spiroplasma poulsonii TaxID=2138 RepID=UPI001F4D2C58|nr:hypothetical protein [Spiroplasma poulsonii]UNF61382.1 hypothetical protein MNU24_05555 [Spiroplasma poulsonii]
MVTSFSLGKNMIMFLLKESKIPILKNKLLVEQWLSRNTKNRYHVPNTYKENKTL